MELPHRLARFNRRVTNPVHRLWAGWAPTYAIIEHVGRRSGKPYRTPVNALTTSITDPRMVSKAEAATYVTRGRRVFTRLPFEQAVLFTQAE
jgi:hypothetical protein